MATRKDFFHHGSLCLLSLFSSPFAFSNLINDDFKGIVLNEDEGEVYQYPDRVTGEGTRRLTIKVSKLQGSNSVSYVSESFTPGDAIQLHKHSNEEELIFVHKGSGIFTLDDKEFPVRSGLLLSSQGIPGTD